VLDDVALFEEDVPQHDAPFRLATGEELERHREVLELLLLGILHDGARLTIALDGESLLVPAYGLGLLLQRCGESGKRPDLRAQVAGWLVVLICWHSKETHGAGLNSAVSLGDIAVFILVGLVAGFLASLVVMGRGRGWFWNLIIGVLGAIIGGWLAGVLHVSNPYGIFGQIVIAFIGALILLLIWRVLFRRGKK
jgi:uncharacterized membrane protein YeaQ/YmgE (transglycosylase-associated protein family)